MWNGTDSCWWTISHRPSVRRSPKVERNHSVNVPALRPGERGQGVHERDVAVDVHRRLPVREARRRGEGGDPVRQGGHGLVVSARALDQRRGEVEDDGAGGTGREGAGGVARPDGVVHLVEHGQDLLVSVSVTVSVMFMTGCRDRARGLDTPTTMSSKEAPP